MPLMLIIRSKTAPVQLAILVAWRAWLKQVLLPLAVVFWLLLVLELLAVALAVAVAVAVEAEATVIRELLLVRARRVKLVI